MIVKVSTKKYCDGCKYLNNITKDKVKIRYCSLYEKAISKYNRRCEHYYYLRKQCKTKQLAIAEYNKYLDDEYFKSNKDKLSKSKYRKVLKYRKEHKKI